MRFETGKTYKCEYRIQINGVPTDKWSKTTVTVIKRTPKFITLNAGGPDWVSGKHKTYIDAFDVERTDSSDFCMQASNYI